MSDFTLVGATIADGSVTNIGVSDGIIKFIGNDVIGESIDAKAPARSVFSTRRSARVVSSS